MKKMFFGILLSWLTVITMGSQTQPWIPNYVITQLNGALFPLSTTNCESLRFYYPDEKHEIELTNVIANTEIFVHFSLLVSPGIAESTNIVGFTRIKIPATSPIQAPSFLQIK